MRRKHRWISIENNILDMISSSLRLDTNRPEKGGRAVRGLQETAAKKNKIKAGLDKRFWWCGSKREGAESGGGCTSTWSKL